jgi:hypothetical protein
MKKVAGVITAVLIAFGLAVQSGAAVAASSEKAKVPESGIVGKIPPGSPFSKIQIGMSMQHVYDLIGEPTDTVSYPTGKAFNPFYYGGDRYRTEVRYKGQGRITFAGRQHKVYRIIYDPKEKGYND